MLDNIRLHLHSDDRAQESIEAEFAVSFKTTYERNKRAFMRHIPSIAKDLHTYKWLEKGIFLNKQGECNIVDQSNGCTFYGLNPKSEIAHQYANRLTDAPRLNLSAPAHPPAIGLLESIDCMVVLGIGLGHHLKHIIRHHDTNHIVIYEPDTQCFLGSLLCFDWSSFLDTCQEKNTRLYLQLGEDGSNVVTDLSELQTHFALNDVSIYKHYNNSVFNGIERGFRRFSWRTLTEVGLSLNEYLAQPYELPTWTPPSDIDRWVSIIPSEHKMFLDNIQAFKRYFPDIARQFENYLPTQWQPYKDPDGLINIFSVRYPESYHGDNPKAEGKLNYEFFANYPNRDGLVFGYKGTKLKSYTHYRFVKATESLVEETEERQGTLPDEIKSLILFGLSSGYQLEMVAKHHTIDHLYICEPEPDFFYASLFAFNWADLLMSFDQREARIYINIGDNGDNLFKDLMVQFYAVGPYTLVNTFFYQSYYRKDLEQSISQLREQLRVVIAFGEYFDHVRYGITHTVEALDRGYPFLKHKPSQYLTEESKNVPIFIIGNGPSLDESLSIIKEASKNAIIVSCGTALKTLYKNEIKPDFHAEIEQNRSTFDWTSRVGDFEFLKNTTLVSCNGIHPDTCELFGEILLAFKNGESSTVSTLSLSDEKLWSIIEYAFPTVSNLAVNIFLELEFSEVYFFGVDLGFIDETKHHSSQSGYYDEKGNERYSYAKKNALVHKVKGNFRPYVGTKHEFKVAKEILEQSIKSPNTKCYNCSDGALIKGAIPLKPEKIKIDETSKDKELCIHQIKNAAFDKVAEKNTFKEAFNAKFSLEKFKDELSESIKLAEATLAEKISVNVFVERQKHLLFNSYKSQQSLLFYLLYGSSNYASSVLSKIELVSNESNQTSELASLSNETKTVLNEWIKFLHTVQTEYLEFPDAYDFVSSFDEQRQSEFKKLSQVKETIYLVCPKSFQETFKRRFYFDVSSGYSIVAVDENSLVEIPDNAALFIMTSHLESLPTFLHEVLSQKSNLFVVLADENSKKIEELKSIYLEHRYCFVLNSTPMHDKSDIEEMSQGKRPYSCHGLVVSYMVHALANQRQTQYLIPKLIFVENSEDGKLKYTKELDSVLGQFEYVYDYPNYVIATKQFSTSALTNSLGGRARPMRYYEGCVDYFIEDLTESDRDLYISHFLTGEYGFYKAKDTVKVIS